MACNDNVVKNMANEIARNCQTQNVTVDHEFVTYIIDLYLLNPKYGKLFSKTINRNNLQYFVEKCVEVITHGGTGLNILKIQFIIQKNYGDLRKAIETHNKTIEKCLRPLFTEILQMDPDPSKEEGFQKLFRKISIYCILESGLGNPGFVPTLKEGMAALESVFSIEELKGFVGLPVKYKAEELTELLAIVSGVRLFNRDCKKGGEGIPDLPFNLVDAGKACIVTLSNNLISVMQKVNSLTTAIEDSISIEESTGNVVIDPQHKLGVSKEEYQQIFELLAFNRQYEVFIRKLLADVEAMTEKGAKFVEKVKAVLQELHDTVKYKDAVPVQNVFPLFAKLWHIWRSMQNVMYLVSTVNRLMTILATIQEGNKIDYNVLEKLLRGKIIITDQSRISIRPSTDERVSLSSLVYHLTNPDNLDPNAAEYLGFCALCLTVGALVPSNMKLGLFKFHNKYYGFCNVKMATRFSKEPQRYINEILHYAREHPYLINLLNMMEDVHRVKDVSDLVVIRLPPIQTFNKNIQTETHPIPEYKDRNYSSDLWEWRKRACKWATIVNYKTHSTQTHYSHLRSEVQCQTFEPRDKCLQTKKDCGINTVAKGRYLWGLRGQRGLGQHSMDLTPPHCPEKLKAHPLLVCTCLYEGQFTRDSWSSDNDRDPLFYFPQHYTDSTSSSLSSIHSEHDSSA